MGQWDILEGLVDVNEAGKTKSHIDRHQGVNTSGSRPSERR